MNPAEFSNIAKSEREFWWYRGMRRILFRILAPFATPEIKNVLEAGCGTGYLSQLLATRFDWRMTPLDLGREGLHFARNFGLERLVQGDITALPFAPASFDALISMDVVVHLPRGQEHRAFQEFARVVRPQGLLVIRVSALDALRSRHSEFAQERQRFARARLLDAAAKAGFRPLRVTYCNSLLLPIAWFKFRIWEPLTKAPPASGVEPIAPWLDSLLAFPLEFEAGWIGAGGNFPLGQSLVLVARRESR